MSRGNHRIECQERSCRQCGGPFTPVQENQEYCRPSCGVRFRKDAMLRRQFREFIDAAMEVARARGINLGTGGFSGKPEQKV